MSTDNQDIAQERQEQKLEIGERLKKARELSGLSQGQVAKMMNMHRPTVSEIEAGRRRVSADELRQFAEFYQVSSAWLMHGAEEGNLNDPRFQLIARELSRLKSEDIDRLMALLQILKSTEGE